MRTITLAVALLVFISCSSPNPTSPTDSTHTPTDSTHPDSAKVCCIYTPTAPDQDFTEIYFWSEYNYDAIKALLNRENPIETLTVESGDMLISLHHIKSPNPDSAGYEHFLRMSACFVNQDTVFHIP